MPSSSAEDQTAWQRSGARAAAVLLVLCATVVGFTSASGQDGDRLHTLSPDGDQVSEWQVAPALDWLWLGAMLLGVLCVVVLVVVEVGLLATSAIATAGLTLGFLAFLPCWTTVEPQVPSWQQYLPWLLPLGGVGVTAALAGLLFVVKAIRRR